MSLAAVTPIEVNVNSGVQQVNRTTAIQVPYGHGIPCRKLINKSDIPVMSIRPATKKDTSSFTIQ